MSDDLAGFLAEFAHSPYEFVIAAFPWGEEGTELAEKTGPEPWQEKILRRIGQKLLTIDQAIQEAIASGHGIGKSAFVAWLILWAISTREDTRGVVTANTETQLRTKTWAELGKWYRLFIGRELFSLTATALFSRDKSRQRTWRIDMVPWSEKNTEAFAGLHNQGKRVLVLFDEGSAIPDIIWETAEGALTDADTEIIWFVAGNPTKSSGRFYDCFHKNAHRWDSEQIDSRTVSHTNKKQLAAWIEDRGLDSDFVKVRVLGQFPSVGESEFISPELVRAAMARRDTEIPEDEPIVVGVDVARFGKNDSVIWPRRGFDAFSIPREVYSGKDTQELADLVLATCRRLRTGLVAVDGGGVGAGVVDRLRVLGLDVVEVQFGAKAAPRGGREIAKYANKRAELWGSYRDWLRHGMLPDDDKLLEQSVGPMYTITKQEEILLERKDAMERRGVPSPDDIDAFTTTFAIDTSFLYSSNDNKFTNNDVDYNPFGGLRASPFTRN